MDTVRLLLFLSLALAGTMLWQAWEQDYGAAPAAAPVAQSPAATELPSTAVTPDTAAVSTPPPAAAAAQLPVPAAPVSVRTDLFEIEISLQGAGIRRAALLQYPVAIDQPDQPMLLLDDNPAEIYLLQGGLVSNTQALTHAEHYRSAARHYEMSPGQDELVVSFQWQGGSLQVVKEYVFRRGQYDIDVRYRISNTGTVPWSGRAYTQIQRTDPGRAGRRLIYTYTGAVFSSPENRYEKIDFDDMQEQKIERDVANGWVAMLQHYFVTALIPSQPGEVYRYYTLSLGQDRYALGAMAPATTVAAGASGVATHRVYMGPKIQHTLEQLAEGLELTVDYGMLWFIAKPLFWCLLMFHDLTGNWGWAIILVTVLLKGAFYWLSAAGYRSMANMRRVQPRLKAMQERYKGDRAKLNQAMMQIYKEEKINPLGGCFPILVQIPVFIALYWVLLETVEMRQAGFVLWLNDLSTPDPYWVLPVIMGVTMLIQQKLNPAPLDPVQEKVMMIMPFAFTIFFGFFPSGLVLYWVVNNILSIAQQWLITRSMVKPAANT